MNILNGRSQPDLLQSRCQDTSFLEQTMISWALCLSFLHLSVALEISKTLGVHPNLIAKYVPLKSGNWNCLDGSKQIPWNFVNDDSCDCPDGSDEPGPDVSAK